MIDDALGSSLVLVAGHSKPHALGAQLHEHVLDAGIGLGAIGEVIVVIFLEVLEHAVHRLDVALVLGQHALDEAAHAVAHKEWIGSHTVGGIAVLLKSVVGGVAQVFDCVEQGAV